MQSSVHAGFPNRIIVLTKKMALNIINKSLDSESGRQHISIAQNEITKCFFTSSLQEKFAADA
jgi:hypothetical protein